MAGLVAWLAGWLAGLAVLQVGVRRDGYIGAGKKVRGNAGGGRCLKKRKRLRR